MKTRISNIASHFIVSIVTATLTAVPVTIVTQYFVSEWKAEDLTVFYRANNEMMIDQPDLSVSFGFSNRGTKSVLIEDIKLLQINGRDLELNICDDQFLKTSIPFWESLGRGLNEKNNEAETKGDKKYYLLPPKDIYIDNNKTLYSAFSLDDHKVKTVVANFPIAKIDWSNEGDGVVFCPVIKFFDTNGRSRISICEGWWNRVSFKDSGPYGKDSESAPYGGVYSRAGISTGSMTLLPFEKSCTQLFKDEGIFFNERVPDQK